MSFDRDYKFLDQLFLRCPFYSPDDYAPEQLKEVVLRRQFQNALFLASPDFYRALEKKEFSWDALEHSQRLSLFKYYNRMSFRATPFGAFSGFTPVRWDQKDQIRLVERNRSFLSLLPSWEWLQEWRGKIKTQQNDFYLLTNPTLMPLGDRLSFFRTQLDEPGKIQFRLNGIAAESLNLHLTNTALAKPVRKSELEQLITGLTACNATEAAAYLEFLIQEQVLLSEFDGSLVEKEGPVFYPWPKERTLQRSFDGELDLPKGISLVETRYPDEEFKGNHFYGALQWPVQEGGLAPVWQQDIRAAIEVLQKIVIPFPTPALKIFASSFTARFESQRISILTALDPDAGLGYDDLYSSPNESELLKDLPFPNKNNREKRMEWSKAHQLFFRLWQQNAGRAAFDPLNLDPSDFAELDGSYGEFQMPPSIAFLFSKSENQLVLENNGGASATSLIGRFSAFSEPVWALCRKIAAAEARANPDVIFAELHVLSEAHIDNINRRKPIYDYVIPLNGFVQDTGQKVIALNDLVVSVHAGNVMLESLSLGKRVIPRLPTAYNFHHTPMAIFRFLGDLQFQGLQANLTLDLEKLFPGMEFYPRVVFQKTVLSLARWRLSEPDILHLTTGKLSIGRLHILRERRGIPAWISTGISDQQLIFNLAADEQALFFLRCLKGLKSALVREYMQPDQTVTVGKARLAGQFVALITRTSKVYQGVLPAKEGNTGPIQRAYHPGSEWIYFKVYCTEQSAEQLLLTCIQPLIAAHQKEIKCWFFVRYKDPEPHLRLRILSGAGSYGRLMKALRRGFSADAAGLLIRRLSLETYQREIERYGPEIMELAESCFSKGSDLAVCWLASKDTATESVTRPFGLVYRSAATFMGNEASLAGFFRDRTAAFLAEFAASKLFRNSLDRKYRTLSKHLFAEIDKGCDPEEPETEFLHSMTLISEKTRLWAAEKRMQLLADLIHMQVNRLFNQQQRQHEALIYFCLSKYMFSVIAKISMLPKSLTDQETRVKPFKK